MVYNRFGKRAFDLLIALVLVIGLSWLLLLILLSYCLLLEFPVFYVQTRIGKDNRPFRMWKFRTLSSKEELPLGKRTFPLGTFLRTTNLDELPQLINILAGAMSFIGPRPLPEEYLPLYSGMQIKRHGVKPGITGLAQVNGRNSIPWQKKFELDLYYVSHITFKLDLAILLKTLALLLSFRKDVSLTEEKFTGN